VNDSGRFAPQPLIRSVTHCFYRAILEPGHKWAIEDKICAALRPEEAPNVLRIPVGFGDRRCA
jgi:hypothetical protein